MPAKILLVEDETAIREMLAMTLKRAGFDISAAGDIPQAQELIHNRLPDLILLDWMLPGISGLEFARILKKDAITRSVPIIMVTARSEDADRARGAEVGVNDYITKPFSPRELVERIKSLLPQASQEQYEENRIEFHGLVMDLGSHRVSSNGQIVNLGPTEFRLLRYLMTHPEKVHSRSHLLGQVWRDATVMDERTVDVHIRRLRLALSIGDHDRYIQTVRGSGYRFSALA